MVTAEGEGVGTVIASWALALVDCVSMNESFDQFGRVSRLESLILIFAFAREAMSLRTEAFSCFPCTG